MPAVRSASGPISVPACDAPISMGTPSSAMRGWFGSLEVGHEAPNGNGRSLSFPYALKYAICVVVASSRPFGDHNSPFWSP